MKLPGFTAEASAYRAGDRYSAGHLVGLMANRVVPCPRRPPGPSCGDCIWDTYDYPAPGTCAQLCIDPGDFVPYPVPCDPSQCPVQCTRCLSYITGRYQSCRGDGYGSGAWVSCGVQRAL